VVVGAVFSWAVFDRRWRAIVHSALVVADEDAPRIVSLLAEGTGGFVRTGGVVGNGGIAAEGLFTSKEILPNQRIVSFNGEIISVQEYHLRTARDKEDI